MVDGWNVFRMGSLCICSASIETSFINTTYYFFNKGLPVAFTSTPHCVGSARSSDPSFSDSSYTIDFAQTSKTSCTDYIGGSGNVKEGVYVICMGSI